MWKFLISSSVSLRAGIWMEAQRTSCLGSSCGL